LRPKFSLRKVNPIVPNSGGWWPGTGRNEKASVDFWINTTAGADQIDRANPRISANSWLQADQVFVKKIKGDTEPPPTRVTVTTAVAAAAATILLYAEKNWQKKNTLRGVLEEDGATFFETEKDVENRDPIFFWGGRERSHWKGRSRSVLLSVQYTTMCDFDGCIFFTDLNSYVVYMTWEGTVQPENTKLGAVWYNNIRPTYGIDGACGVEGERTAPLPTRTGRGDKTNE